MSPSPENLLRWLLRFGGMVLLLAFPTIFLPTEWMVATHQRMGLGPLPEPSRPIFEYLARTIAPLYGSRGVVYLLLSTDVRRYAPVIGLFGCLAALYGAIALGVGIVVGMPWWWTLFEGPGLIGFGLVLFLLARRVPAWATEPHT
ncbi:MAG: hypothetical protein AAGN46_05225 [Acidobacteriota bacterium]